MGFFAALVGLGLSVSVLTAAALGLVDALSGRVRDLRMALTSSGQLTFGVVFAGIFSTIASRSGASSGAWPSIGFAFVCVAGVLFGVCSVLACTAAVNKRRLRAILRNGQSY